MVQPAQMCPMHTDEHVQPVAVLNETMDYLYTCNRTDGHGRPGPYSWPWSAPLAAVASTPVEFDLDVTLVQAVTLASQAYGCGWVEYGLVERAFALANPEQWSALLAQHDHTKYNAKGATRKDQPYTASKRLGQKLGILRRREDVAFQQGPGTDDGNITIRAATTPRCPSPTAQRRALGPTPAATSMTTCRRNVQARRHSDRPAPVLALAEMSDPVPAHPRGPAGRVPPDRSSVRARVHRGGREIGGSCVEVEAAGSRLVLDVGKPLDAGWDDVVPLPPVAGLGDGGDPSLLAVLITHGHLDHYGLLDQVAPSVTVYAGAASSHPQAQPFVPTATSSTCSRSALARSRSPHTWWTTAGTTPTRWWWRPTDGG